MEKRSKQLLMALAGMIYLLVTGCSSPDIPVQPEKGGFCFYLNMPAPMTVETKTGANIGNADDQIAVNDVWIIQYLESDKTKPFRCLYISGSDNITSEGNYLVKIKTPDNNENKFSDVQSDFFIIVNGGGNLLSTDYSSSESDLLAMKTYMENSGYLSVTTPLLTAGPIVYTPKTGDGTATTDETPATDEPAINDPTTNEPATEKVVFVSRMYRAYAKVAVKVNFQPDKDYFPNASFTVTKCTATNLPLWKGASDGTDGTGDKANVIALYESSEGYPSASDVTGSETWSPSSAQNQYSFSFYMPENLRGTGSSKTFEGKNQESNGPNGTLTGCTCITIEGEYRYDTNQSPITVKYTFYPGVDLTSDYNIKRDHCYNLTLNLKGANSADLRVSITNGNVAVFDKVVTIDNTVEF